VRYGLAAHELQLDEFDTVSGGRNFGRAFFHTLFAISPVGRGPERLSALVFAAPNAIFNNTPTVFRASHVLFGLLYLSAAVPVYALARGLGLARWQAIFPAAAAILTPWMLFGGTMLNVTLAYPTAMALAWATWNTMVRPGWRADALVLLFCVLGAMARESHAAFALSSGVAVLLQVWRDRPPHQSMRDALRAYPGRVFRTHPLLVGAAGALLLVILVYGTHRLLGSAYQPTSSSTPVNLHTILHSTWTAVSELTIGTGYLPMIIALPWLAHELFRPRTREAGALAAVSIAMFGAFIAMIVYFAATTAGFSDNERYIAVLAGLPPLLAAVALFRREVGPLAVTVCGLLLTRAVVTQGLYPTTAPYDYFLAPARLFFTVVMQGQLSSRLPFNDHYIATTLLLVAVVIAIAVALLAHMSRMKRWWPAVAALTLGVPIALGAAAGIYDGNHFEALATFPSVTFEEQSFVDVANDLKPVAFWDYAPAGDLRIPYEANQAAFFNRSVHMTLRLQGMPATANVGPSNTATVDTHTGRLHASSPLPSYILAPVRFTRMGFAATTIAGPSSALGPMPFVLERLDGQPHLAYAVTGTEDEGWILSPHHTAIIRLFPSAQSRCWQTDVVAPPILAEPIHYAIAGPGIHQVGVLPATAAALLDLRSPKGAPATLRIHITGAGKLPNGTAVAGGIYTFTATDCPSG
jgi:hypothetical protein